MEITENRLAALNGSLDNIGIRKSEIQKWCNGCKTEICCKLVMKAAGHFWHPECMACYDCGGRLEQKCFSRDEMIFCSKDFYRRFGPKCTGCNQTISPTQIVRKINNRVYHISCMCCLACNKQLATGDEFYLLEDGRVICKEDYNENDPTSDINQERTKRARTFISTSQLTSLKLAYCTTPKPGLKERENIAKETGLDMRVVQVWFQNRRAKDRRIMNKGRFPWLQTANRRARHMRSHSWSPGALRFSGMTEEEELDDLNDVHRICEEESIQPSDSHLQNNQQLVNKCLPDSPCKLTEKARGAQNNLLSTQMADTYSRMIEVSSVHMAGEHCQASFNYPERVIKEMDAFGNRILYQGITNDSFSHNKPVWSGHLSQGLNFSNQDLKQSNEVFM